MVPKTLASFNHLTRLMAQLDFIGKMLTNIRHNSLKKSGLFMSEGSYLSSVW